MTLQGDLRGMSGTVPLTVQMRAEEGGDAAAGVHDGRLVVAEGPVQMHASSFQSWFGLAEPLNWSN